MPHPTLPNFWTPRGIIHREAYVAAGLTLAAIKFALDAWVAWALFDRTWTPVRYFAPSEYAGLLTFDGTDRAFFGTLLLFSLPFAWIGVMLTIRRLRAAGLPLWLSGVFFAPLLNIVLFIALSVLPTQSPDDGDDQQARHPSSPITYLGAVLPPGPWGAGVLAVFLAGLLGLGGTVLGTQVITFYGWGMFTALPFCLGLFSVLIFSYHQTRTYASCLGVATCSIAVVAGLMLVFAVEGVVCLIMALPLWAPCAWLGASVGYTLQRGGRWGHAVPHLLLAIGASLPLIVTAEYWADPSPPLRSVSTAVTVAAAPQPVWDHVIAFPALPAPGNWPFTAGVAYPTHATITGRGEDAVRYCTFSTGSFIEPIEVWDEPRLLRFAVTHNPPTMREWSIRRDVQSPHLVGFLSSERGQFRLTRSSDGQTHLEGTTWYRNRMWPQAYWGLWSDYIIHRIHEQVLQHIETLAETTTPSAAH